MYLEFRKKNYMNNMDSARCFLVIMLTSMLIMLARFPFDVNVYTEVFQKDILDTGMDFFNSVICVKNGRPYTDFHTLYPPLANLFYYYFYLCVPEDVSNFWNVSYIDFYGLRRSIFDLRLWQDTLMPYIIYVQIQTIICYLILSKCFTRQSTSLSISILFSSCMLFAVERGNIIILTLALVVIYCKFYYSEMLKYRLFAYLSLGVAVGLKIYPILFSFLLIRRKMYKQLFIVLLISSLLLFLPFVFFEGFEGFVVWIDVLFNFGTGKMNFMGKDFIGLYQAVAVMLKNGYFPSIFLKYSNSILMITKYSCLFLGLILLSSTLLYDKEWKSLLAIGITLSLCQANSPVYNLLFVIPSLIAYMNEEIVIQRNHIIYFLFFVIQFSYLPVFGLVKLLWGIRFVSLLSVAVLLVIPLFEFVQTNLDKHYKFDWLKF